MKGLGKTGIAEWFYGLWNTLESAEWTADALRSARVELLDGLIAVYVALEFGLSQNVHLSYPIDEDFALCIHKYRKDENDRNPQNRSHRGEASGNGQIHI